MTSIEESVRDIALRAQAASRAVGRASEKVRNQALFAMAASLRGNMADILAGNKVDMEAGKAAGMSSGLLDRLSLDEGRINAMADALESLAGLPDPLGRVLERREIEGGIELTRVSVSLGVVAMVYEARPNVTADAAGICLKSGNACVLRGGSQALHSNAAIVSALREAVVSAGLPADCVSFVDTADRAATDALMQLHGIVDVLIPRGGAGLIRHCIECSKVPVIETGTGNCHTYVHETADFDRAITILLNAKTQRVGVCNACESLDLSGVLFVVAGDPWMKHGRALTPAEDRFAMVQAAIEGDVRFAASRMEIDRVGETYTVDTLRELRRLLPAHVELCFLMGADAAARLGEWREASELGGLARFAVVSQRDDVALDERGLSRLAQIIGAREILQVEMPRMDVSSTNLREKVRTRRSIRDEVPAVVADYIESHGLYQR